MEKKYSLEVFGICDCANEYWFLSDAQKRKAIARKMHFSNTFRRPSIYLKSIDNFFLGDAKIHQRRYIFESNTV